MDSVEALLTQVAKKRKLDPTVKGLDSLISALRRWQREAEAGSSGTDALREQVSEQGLQELVHGHHKAVNAAVSKLGKGIDKAMASHVELPLERMPGALISQAVHQHLMAEGSFEAARLMSIDSAGGSERGGEVEAALEAALREMHAVLLALQRHELGPAFAWLERHREGLEAKSSTLEFRLRQLEFTLLLRRGETSAAARQAREALVPSADAAAARLRAAGRAGDAAAPHAAVRRLLGCLGFASRLESSPYADLLSAEQWSSAARIIETESLALLGQARRNPLRVCVEAGSLALPSLTKLASVLGGKLQATWHSGEQIPVEIALPAELRFHSVFTCPVSKEGATPDNPPMMLPCGHVLALDSIAKLARGSRSLRFKCPYCPSECSTAMAKQLLL